MGELGSYKGWVHLNPRCSSPLKSLAQGAGSIAPPPPFLLNSLPEFLHPSSSLLLPLPSLSPSPLLSSPPSHFSPRFFPSKPPSSPPFSSPPPFPFSPSSASLLNPHLLLYSLPSRSPPPPPPVPNPPPLPLPPPPPLSPASLGAAAARGPLADQLAEVAGGASLSAGGLWRGGRSGRRHLLSPASWRGSRAPTHPRSGGLLDPL